MKKINKIMQCAKKNDEKRLSGGGEVQNKKIRKMMRKDVSEGRSSKNPKK
jgi:hypothetical protein